MKEAQKEWKEFENLIHQIYTDLEPVADVILNDHIKGINSNTQRQIDISIRSKIANHEILIIVQAKDHKRRADIKIIDEFDSVIKDVQASKGILICNSGFTRKAKEYAQKLKIDLCTAHDASTKKWQTEIQIPVLKKSIKVEIKIQHHYVVTGPTKLDGVNIPFPNFAMQQFLEKWENNEISKEPGTHYLPLKKGDIKFHNDLSPIKNGIEYTIIQRHHFKFFAPKDYRGIRDYITQKFTPSFMLFEEKIPFIDDGTWKFIEEPTKIAVKSLQLNIELLRIDFTKKEMIRFIWEHAD